eukprot:1157673-Pelagomonas_calceolata.AAC.3
MGIRGAAAANIAAATAAIWMLLKVESRGESATLILTQSKFARAPDIGVRACLLNLVYQTDGFCKIYDVIM